MGTCIDIRLLECGIGGGDVYTVKQSKENQLCIVSTLQMEGKPSLADGGGKRLDGELDKPWP